MNALKYLPRYTYLDYETWEGSWELVEGIPHSMSPAPNVKHQRISAKLSRYLDEALEHCAKCYVSLPIDWKVNEHTVVQPDLLVLCHELDGHYLENTPELLIEILSPSTAHRDRHMKYELYEEQGVKYYLIVNLIEECIEIYLLDKNYQLADTIDKTNTSFEFSLKECRFTVDFSKIW